MNQNQESQLTLAESGQYTLKAKKVDLGLLGKFFGSRENAPMNIAGFILILLVAAGTIPLFWETKVPAGDVWKIILPIVTLTLGYLFGKKA